jgi:hypothetical protein
VLLLKDARQVDFQGLPAPAYLAEGLRLAQSEVAQKQVQFWAKHTGLALRCSMHCIMASSGMAHWLSLQRIANWQAGT